VKEMINENKILLRKYSPSIFGMIKSRRMGWTGHVACMGGGGEKRNVYKTVVRKSEKKRPLGSCKHKWGIILNWIVEKQIVRMGMDRTTILCSLVVITTVNGPW
jgi:hypothetical protein